MTFQEWRTAQEERRDRILIKLSTFTSEEVAEYFNYDNMVAEEPDFCPLYKTNSKCHDVENLNCYLCGCPYFKSSDTTPFSVADGVKVMSICSINAVQASTFIQDGVQQCDCSQCLVPHRKSVAIKALNNDL